MAEWYNPFVRGFARYRTALCAATGEPSESTPPAPVDCNAIEAHALTEPGGHVVNEDAHGLRTHPDDPACWLCCLADGQGGQAGGADASELACQAAMRAACALPVARLANARTWVTLLEATDRSVAADADAGYTTLVGFAVVAGRIVGASSGDSAVVLVDRSGHRILTENQSKNPPVGSGGATFVPFEAALAEPWRVVAMSDGVWKPVGWAKVVEALRSRTGQDLLDQLRDQARSPRSGALSDDFTAVTLGRGGVITPAAGGRSSGP